jgi:Rps23 Pro-64 3,4-dihydroxylase Tpa1-like proline 4-hydroxylase
MHFINESKLQNITYEDYPFPHTIIDGFLNNDVLNDVLLNINNLNDKDTNDVYINPYSPFEYNKYAFSRNYGEYLKYLFMELNSPEFIQYLENITGIKGIITNDIELQGAGIHRIRRGGYLQLHTDFNTYYSGIYGKLDRRINLLIYMNPSWKDEYNGSLCICDKQTETCVKKIPPLLNRCVIFNTSNKSIHGHPEVLNTPENICRQSIAVYYYTKNENRDVDFEGDREHTTIWYPNIKV